MKYMGFVIVLDFHSIPPCLTSCCNVVFANESHVLLISNDGSQITDWSVCLYITAREQLRRARHSRTFLVESGTGELWSEMQTGKKHSTHICHRICHIDGCKMCSWYSCHFTAPETLDRSLAQVDITVKSFACLCEFPLLFQANCNNKLHLGLNVGIWCPETAWHLIQGVFPNNTQCFQDWFCIHWQR